MEATEALTTRLLAFLAGKCTAAADDDFTALEATGWFAVRMPAGYVYKERVAPLPASVLQLRVCLLVPIGSKRNSHKYNGTAGDSYSCT